MLARCVSLDEMCAEICTATARTLARVAYQETSAARHQLEACREMCHLCAEECEKHDMEHCRLCAQACRSAEDACSKALHGMMQTA